MRTCISDASRMRTTEGSKNEEGKKHEEGQGQKIEEHRALALASRLLDLALTYAVLFVIVAVVYPVLNRELLLTGS